MRLWFCPLGKGAYGPKIEPTRSEMDNCLFLNNELILSSLPIVLVSIYYVSLSAETYSSPEILGK